VGWVEVLMRVLLSEEIEKRLPHIFGQPRVELEAAVNNSAPGDAASSSPLRVR
jgi:hypothetical protein